MRNRLAVRRKYINLASRENSVHSVKRLGKFGRKNEAEKPEGQIKN
jgi:hypothetical protein